MSLILRQGLDADRLLVNFDSGEMVWTTDSQQLFVGDGSTPGGLNISSQLHDHDVRYFLKAEVVGLLSLKADVTALTAHTSSTAEHRIINDTGTSLTDLWSASKILAALATKAGVLHNHNTLYYTKAEVDLLVTNDEFVKVNATDTASSYLAEKVAPGNGMTILLNSVDFADNRLQFISDVYVTPINGFPMPVYINTLKGNKILSTTIGSYSWSEIKLSNNDWMEVGTARDTRTGHIMPFDGTLVGITVHISDTNNETGTITIFKNAAQIHTFNVSGANEQASVDMNINVDFNLTDKFRIRYQGGAIEDTLVSILVQWRA